MKFCSIARSSLFVSIFSASALLAQSHRPHPTTTATTASADASPATMPADASPLKITQHDITLDGKSLHYTATTGLMPMKDETGKLKANIFFVAYTTHADDLSKRPLTFLFNGGPGAAAIWLHLGGAGPKTVALDDNSLPIGPPFKTVDNPASWLGSTDMVFIDPVSTGYSRAANGEDPKQFHGVQPDVESVAEFIRVYITKYGRWGSPIYLAGESYGTTRASAMAGFLAERYGIAVNGITLISSVLDFKTLIAGPGNDLPYEMYLPSFAAVAWYHKKLSPDYQADLNKTIEAAKKFATDEYTPALLKGSAITAEERTHLIKQMSAFTGLSEAMIDRDNLRINPGQFENELLGGHNIIGRFDARITAFDPDNWRGAPSFDPSLSLYLPAYTSAFNQYVRNELHYESDLPYEALTDKIQPWDVNNLYVVDDLQAAILQNPHLRVEFFSGYFDLATPFFSADYTINRMNLSPETRGNITHLYFPSGHMIYHNRACAKKMADTVKDFVSPNP
jgi:carboxypeptidase C (cathepsin A)